MYMGRHERSLGGTGDKGGSEVRWPVSQADDVVLKLNKVKWNGAQKTKEAKKK